MAKVSSHTGKDLYKIVITSPSGNTVIADEPVTSGGQDKGFSPTELLAASLAACTSATLRMYADNKGWNLDAIDTEIDLSRDEEANQTIINRNIVITGQLDDMQKARLLAIANKCPVHKILSNQIVINTQLA